MACRGSALMVLVVLAAEVTAQTITEAERRHWAFQPLKRVSAPQVRSSNPDIRNPVDAFIAARLEKAGLTPSREASRTEILRRVTFDLIGLPPSVEEIDAALRDPSPDWYERVVERLLASPHFGERWGRHWLDGAGYVDVTGGDNDAATVKLADGSKWKYRDYVIRCVNEDRPWAQFLTEQIAGDELDDWRNATRFTPQMVERLIATGFLRTSADDTDENELNTLDIRHGVQQRTGEVLINNLLGLTLGCAKCHDHKYEPIGQQDYYRVMALLGPALNPQQWLQPGKRTLADVPPALRQHIDKHNAAIDAHVKELAKKDNQAAQELAKQKQSYGTIQAVYDVGAPTPTHLLRRGEYNRPGIEVAPGFLSIFGPTALPLTEVHGATSGRRLALARWLTDTGTPVEALALRVRVNRVWHQLFGRGLVATCDNFGVTGAKPTHPELLDWLAVEFREQGGQLKPLLHLLVTSHTYRQSSLAQRAPSVDPDNLLLWRKRLRRLESEAIRDSLLAASGKLEQAMGGPAVMTDAKPDGSVEVRAAGSGRRSVYLLQRRNYHPTLLAVFDQPVLSTNCPCRQSSAVVTQSLTLANDTFVREQATLMAVRVRNGVGATPVKQVERWFLLALGRQPGEEEAARCLELLERDTLLGLERVCRVLLNTNEFLYVP